MSSTVTGPSATWRQPWRQPSTLNQIIAANFFHSAFERFNDNARSFIDVNPNLLELPQQTARPDVIDTKDVFGGDVATNNVDLILSATVAIGLPHASSFLLDITGSALPGIILYYGLGCIGVPLWRKRSLDYCIKFNNNKDENGCQLQYRSRKPEFLGLINLMAAGIAIVSCLLKMNWTYFQNHKLPVSSPIAVGMTALLWGPLNGALEQLSWFYVLDSWRNRWRLSTSDEAVDKAHQMKVQWKHRICYSFGVVLMNIYVMMIHTVFWNRFLPHSKGVYPSWFSISLYTLLTSVYTVMYHVSRSMWPVFFLHTLVDLQLILTSKYSILPALIGVGNMAYFHI